MSSRRFEFLKGAALSLLLACTLNILPASADAPPVRIGVVPAGGSGIEQEVVDRLTAQLESTNNVVVSTVNPDWYVVCNIKENMDQMSGQIRYNGTVTVKTTDGQVISNVAVQKYNQDFSLQPGAQLNKALVDGAARDVISGMAERAIGPIQQAVEVEMDTRNRVMAAMQLANEEKFDEAIQALGPITPDTTHFGQVQGMMGQMRLEKHVLELMRTSKGQAAKGSYTQAIATLREVDKKSRFYKLAQQKIASYKAIIARKNAVAKLGKTKTGPGTVSLSKGGTLPPGMSPQSQVQQLNAARRTLQMQEQAIEAKESALQMQQAIDGQQPANKHK